MSRVVISNMVKKNGVTLSALVITVIIISILATAMIVSIASTLSFSKFTAWANELTYIQDAVDERVANLSAFDAGLGPITINVSSLSQDARNEQFEGEIILNFQVNLVILDLGKLKITDTVYGNGEDNTDYYAYSETTGRVYYVEGVETSGETYYTVTSNMFDMFGIEQEERNISSVVFIPSKVGYTNEAIDVTVRVPANYTGISVTASNDIDVSEENLDGTMYEYYVNEEGVEGNYTITVNYTASGVSKVSTYEVNGFDDEAPTLSVQKNTDSAFVVTASDNSRIRSLKYIEGEITSANIANFFENSGKNVINGKITPNYNNEKYTIYAQDMAGNYSYAVIKTLEIGDYIEYNVGYTDVYLATNVYTRANGWRLVKATPNGDGTYSNVIIMSTGIPAMLYYDYNDTSTNKSWWVTNSTTLTTFRNILTSTGGDGTYNFSTSTPYYSLQAAAGLYYNFKDIKFQYATASRGNNLGYFTSITSGNLAYNRTTNNTVERTGGQLFNLFGSSNATVRLLTLPEVNVALGRTDIDKYGANTIGTTQDTIGLYRLDHLSSVPGMNGFTAYSTTGFYWLASPYPGNNSRLTAVGGIGNVGSGSSGSLGVRPAVCLTSNVEFVDTNNNGVPEMVIVSSPIVSVTGITLNTHNVSVPSHAITNEGSYVFTLTATVAPNDATNKNVTWSSSNTSVATVSSEGVVTVSNYGDATITVTTEDGNYTDTCAISVYNGGGGAN